MPDRHGKLSQAEKEKIKAHLEQYGKEHRCPVCDHAQWSVGDHLLQGIIYRGGGLHIGGESYPQFLIICTTCLYTRHFMAVPLGIANVNGDEEKKEEKGAPNG